jgi:xylulokinase
MTNTPTERDSYLVGVDLGTTLAKAAVYDTTGRLLGEAFRETQIRYPRPGIAEQDPAEFYQSAVGTIRAAIEQARISSHRVAALSIDSQAGGILGIDADWQPVMHFDSPLDTRSTSLKRRMMATAGERIFQLSGASPTYGQKILWCKEENPEAWKRVYKFIQPAAYVAGLLAGLSGEQAYMEASFICWSGLSDTSRISWSEELCQTLDVPLRVLPRIVAAHEIVGTLQPAAARDCGLPSGVPIAAGCADAAATLLGASVIEPGLLFDISGTACIFGACINRYQTDEAARTLSCMNGILPEQFYQLAIVLGGRTHDWYVHEFCSVETNDSITDTKSVYAGMDARAASLPPGSDGVLCIPHLGGRWNPPEPNVRGLWMGFGWGHRKEHLYRSILEAVAYEYAFFLDHMRTTIPAIQFEEVRVMGSGAKSRLWNEIKSNVLGLPYRKLARDDLATWGSALLAGHAVGIFTDLAAAARASAEVAENVLPDKSTQQLYCQYRLLYHEVLKRNGTFFDALANIAIRNGL